MTNAEYIRKMSDRELADFLQDMFQQKIDYTKYHCGDYECYDTDCDGCMTWWLELDTKHPQGLEYHGGKYEY